MLPAIELFKTTIRSLRQQSRDDGYTTETVLVTALLVAAALAALAILYATITNKASSIQL